MVVLFLRLLCRSFAALCVSVSLSVCVCGRQTIADEQTHRGYVAGVQLEALIFSSLMDCESKLGSKWMIAGHCFVAKVCAKTSWRLKQSERENDSTRRLGARKKRSEHLKWSLKSWRRVSDANLMAATAAAAAALSDFELSLAGWICKLVQSLLASQRANVGCLAA